MVHGGDFGVLASSDQSQGVFGMTGGADKAGVYGYNERKAGTAYGVIGSTWSNDGAGVKGDNFGESPGVVGQSLSGDGVQGFTSGRGMSGVYGRNDAKEGVSHGVYGSSISSQGAGVHGEGSNGASGVRGYSDAGDGVVGLAVARTKSGVVGACVGGTGVEGVTWSGTGVSGVSLTGVGVLAEVIKNKATKATALYAKSPHVAGIFEGDVVILGNLVVPTGQFIATTANKHGVVAFADGSQRLLCTIESPEAWFEDFGEASLVKGKAHVAFDADFARTIDARRYHVFLMPYGETAGLYVSRRTKSGFDVTEQKPRKSNARFSWRVVARPKFTKHKRFAKTIIPQTLERVHSAIIGDHVSRRVDVAMPKPKLRSVAKLLKRTKPKLSGPPKLPKLPKR